MVNELSAPTVEVILTSPPFRFAGNSPAVVYSVGTT